MIPRIRSVEPMKDIRRQVERQTTGERAAGRRRSEQYARVRAPLRATAVAPPRPAAAALPARRATTSR